MYKRVVALVGAPLLAIVFAAPAAAQSGSSELTDEEWREWQPDPSTLVMPDLEFEPDEGDINNYKKYYYFTREATNFETAFEDIRFCDELARGLATQNYYPDAGATAMYGIGGAIGGVIGGALAQAIYGSAEKRAKRRVNMRRCMHFKGYARHGLAKELWEAFNFEEGNSTVPEGYRQRMLAAQALVASSASTGREDIGL